MKKLDKEQLEVIKGFFNISSVLMVKHLKEKGLIEVGFEVGKWYINDSFVICTISLNDKVVDYYGFQNDVYIDNDWMDECYFNKEMVGATDKEVEQVLIEEAKKRGLWGDIKIEDHVGDYEFKRLNNCSFMEGFGGEMLYNKNGVIFSNGKWAEIKKSYTISDYQSLLCNSPREMGEVINDLENCFEIKDVPMTSLGFEQLSDGMEYTMGGNTYDVQSVAYNPVKGVATLSLTPLK